MVDFIKGFLSWKIAFLIFYVRMFLLGLCDNLAMIALENDQQMSNMCYIKADISFFKFLNKIMLGWLKYTKRFQRMIVKLDMVENTTKYPRIAILIL